MQIMVFLYYDNCTVINCFCARCPEVDRSTSSPGIAITSPLSQHTTPPVSPPIYPSVLKDRPLMPTNVSSPSNTRAPPPVPPRGVRTKRYQGFTKGVV